MNLKFESGSRQNKFFVGFVLVPVGDNMGVTMFVIPDDPRLPRCFDDVAAAVKEVYAGATGVYIAELYALESCSKEIIEQMASTTLTRHLVAMYSGLEKLESDPGAG